MEIQYERFSKVGEASIAVFGCNFEQAKVGVGGWLLRAGLERRSKCLARAIVLPQSGIGGSDQIPRERMAGVPLDDALRASDCFREIACQKAQHRGVVRRLFAIRMELLHVP